MHFAGVDQAIIDDYRLIEYEHAVSAMQNLIEELHAPDRLITQQVVFDKPGAAVRKYSAQADRDLIVVGKHGRSGIDELLTGSVTCGTRHRKQPETLVFPAKRSSFSQERQEKKLLPLQTSTAAMPSS